MIVNINILSFNSVSIDDDDESRAHPPTPPPRKFIGTASFRKKLPCLRKQDSNEWPIMDRGSASSSAELERQRSVSPLDTNRDVPHQRQRALSHIAASLRFAPVPAMAVAGFLPEPGLLGAHRIPHRQSPLRASYHGKSSEPNYMEGHFMNTLEGRKPFSEVVGSAESLVGRVLYEQGLGKYCDPDFVRATQRELAEAFNMTQEGFYLFCL